MALLIFMLPFVTDTALMQFAVQIAVVIAKIARVDYPRQWPSLFSDLLGKLDSSDTLTTRRTYLVLHHVLKELSSKRLAPDQRAFAEVSLQLIHLVNLD